MTPQSESEIQTLTTALLQAMTEVTNGKCSRRDVYARTALIYNEMTLKLTLVCTDPPLNHRANLTSGAFIQDFVNAKLNEMGEIHRLHSSMEAEGPNDVITMTTNKWAHNEVITTAISATDTDIMTTNNEWTGDKVITALAAMNTTIDERVRAKTEHVSNNDTVQQNRKRKEAQAERKQAAEKKRREAAKELVRNRLLTLEECLRNPLDGLTHIMLQEYCVRASLTKRGTLDELRLRLVDAMQQYPYILTLDDYIAKRDIEKIE